MDKNLDNLLKNATINVQGDFVMEKHVEHEVGNVEAGGIGIQIVNSAEKEVDGDRNADKGTTPQLQTLPELNTPEAQTLWLKLQNAGYVDENRQPTGISQNMAAILASMMAPKLKLDPTWPPFEQLWGIKNMAQKFSIAQHTAKGEEFCKILFKIL